MHIPVSHVGTNAHAKKRKICRMCTNAHASNAAIACSCAHIPHVGTYAQAKKRKICPMCTNPCALEVFLALRHNELGAGLSPSTREGTIYGTHISGAHCCRDNGHSLSYSRRATDGGEPLKRHLAASIRLHLPNVEVPMPAHRVVSGTNIEVSLLPPLCFRAINESEAARTACAERTSNCWFPTSSRWMSQALGGPRAARLCLLYRKRWQAWQAWQQQLCCWWRRYPSMSSG